MPMQISEADVLGREAYILCYEKVVESGKTFTSHHPAHLNLLSAYDTYGTYC